MTPSPLPQAEDDKLVRIIARLVERKAAINSGTITAIEIYVHEDRIRYKFIGWETDKVA